jgi:hypothetical protein
MFMRAKNRLISAHPVSMPENISNLKPYNS